MRRGRGGDFLASKIYAMPKSVEIGMQAHSNCRKNNLKMFKIPTSNVTAIIPTIVIFKSCIINQSYSTVLDPSKI